MTPAVQAPSRLTRVYQAVYDLVCGRHPALLPWHFQYLATRELYADLRCVLPQLSGTFLDVGCATKPYQSWATCASNYLGLDIDENGYADVVVAPTASWSIEDETIDVVLCTQVLAHTDDLNHVMTEIYRVLKPGGTLLVTTRFIYNEHDVPRDYWRFSVNGVRQLLERDYDIVDIKPQGGVGSTCGVPFLSWIEVALNSWKPTRLLKGLLLPIWIFLSFLIDLAAILVRVMDHTHIFYSNVFAIAKQNCG